MNKKNHGGVKENQKMVAEKNDLSEKERLNERRHKETIENDNKNTNKQILLTFLSLITMTFIAFYAGSLQTSANSLQEQRDTTFLFPGTAQYIGNSSMSIPLLNQYSTSNRAVIECINVETTEVLFSPLDDYYSLVAVFPKVNVSTCGQYTKNRDYFYNYMMVDSDKPTNLEIYYDASSYPEKANEHTIIITIPQLQFNTSENGSLSLHFPEGDRNYSVSKLYFNTSKRAKINISYHSANIPEIKRTINFSITFGEGYPQPITGYGGKSDNYQKNYQEIVDAKGHIIKLNDSILFKNKSLYVLDLRDSNIIP